MRRLVLGALTALTLMGLWAPARAAEVTRMASSEPGDPFDLHLSIRFDRFQERAQIGRERAGPSGSVVDAEELRYTRKRAALVPRVAVGIYHNVELHFETPYVLWDDRSWRYGQVSGASVGPAGSNTSTIANNDIDANGMPCTSSCAPLFQVDDRKTTTLYHGGRAGDFMAGLAWGIFDDAKDDTKPFWLVGLDITFPTAPRFEPAKNVLDGWINTQSAKAAPFGEKIWKWDLHTILSRRMGPVDPYVKAHATLMMTSNETYSNCEYADEMTAIGQMNSQAPTNCADPSWDKDSRAQLPWVAGLTLGTEVVPFQDGVNHQKVSLDLRLQADYTSSQRFYNELTDMSSRIHATDGYLTAGAFVGLYLQASKNVSLHATFSLATQSSHYLSGESLGRDGSWPALGSNGITADTAAMNPNFDWRYDAPGRRFRLSEVSLFDIFVAGVLEF